MAPDHTRTREPRSPPAHLESRPPHPVLGASFPGIAFAPVDRTTLELRRPTTSSSRKSPGTTLGRVACGGGASKAGARIDAIASGGPEEGAGDSRAFLTRRAFAPADSGTTQHTTSATAKLDPMASKQSNDDTLTRPALSPTVAEHSIQQPDGLATLKNAGDRWSEHLMAFRLLDQRRTQANMVSQQLQIIAALMDEKIDEGTLAPLDGKSMASIRTDAVLSR
ncbi:hypothetical protein LTR53_000431 [Teratosphaeriaceae sp. CCFEE 6253]|nr:hypothetical protein LTR53_000431 [Teratosphaeriaceae sp. CCFEE 6253]